MTLADMGETRSNHTVYNINYHFVWCPKYRHSMLGGIEQTLEASFREVCNEYNYEILSLHISPDHVHLFLSAHPKHSPSEIARKIKSITARESGSNTNPREVPRERWRGASPFGLSPNAGSVTAAGEFNSLRTSLAGRVGAVTPEYAVSPTALEVV